MKKNEKLLEGIIYKYRNKIDNKVYIGQTIDEAKRMYCHKLCKGMNHFHNAIRKYGWDAFEYKVLFRVYCTNKQDLTNTLNIKESLAIRYFNSTDENKGYNILKGGSNSYNPKKRKIVQLTLDGKFIKYWDSIKDAEIGLGINNSWISSCCADMNGVRSCAGCLWMYKEDYIKIIKSGESIKTYHKYNQRAIVQLSKDNEFIKEWPTITNASKILGLSRASIGRSCRRNKKNILAGGFKWQYKEDYESNILPQEKRILERKLVQLSLDGKLVKIWDSISEASKHLGVNRITKQNIVFNNKGNKSYKGFMWMYEEEYKIYKDNINPYKRSKGRSVEIIQLDKNYNFIKSWDSIKDATIGLKIDRETILSCIKNNRPHLTKKYRFMYKKDYDKLIKNSTEDNIN